jgi:LPS export ABC transporter protein LptC
MPGSAGHDGGRTRIVRGRLLGAAAALAAALTVSCSVSGADTDAAPQSPAAIPDTVALGVIHRVNRDGHLSLELRASRAESYNATKTTILSDAHFSEFDDTGAALTAGTAGTVVYHSDNDDAEISGGVRVRSESEKGVVTARSLTWQNKERRLTAPVQEEVTLVKDDGSLLSGTGFSGDFRSREITFTGPAHGTYVSSSEQK